MSAISPEVAFAVPMFLETLTLIKPGQAQPADLLEHPKMMANTVLVLVGGGNEALLDVGDLAIASLARATIALCDAQTDSKAVATYEHALSAWSEVNGHPR